jgi:hypothetical protein
MEYIKRQTSLSANIVAFCRFLRHKGFTIGPQEEADSLRALEALNAFHAPESMKLCLKASLARTRAQQLAFDELYTQYWRELEKAVNAKRKDGEAEKKQNGARKKPKALDIKNWLQGNTSEEEEELAAYSRQESAAYRDFSSFAEESLWEVAQLIRRIARTIALRESRRKKKANKRLNLDLRRTLRLNLRRGGEMLELAYTRKHRHKPQIVLLCDVSKSMDLYSRFLIQFIYAFQHAYQRIEAFVFSASLHRVSRQLNQKAFGDALKELSGSVPGWSGGTRIGAALETFNQRYASGVLNKRTIVIIMSDGWDTGEPELVAENMRKIQKKSAKLIWLNPLAGSAEYEPLTNGMQAAMPYIDVFAPVHNVDSLRKLYRYLK